MLARLSIPQKFLLMGALLFVPLTIVTYRLVASMRALGTEKAQRELSGLRYTEPLVRLLRDLQTHRGLSVALMYGEGEFVTERAKVANQLKEDLQAVDAVDAESGRQLGVHDSWVNLRKEIEDLLAHWQEFGRDLFDKQTQIHADLLRLLVAVGDGSHLSFDPDPGSYYLSDVVRVVIPELTELMGQVRDLALSIATQGGMMREEELKAFSRRYAIVYYYTDRLESDLNKVYAARPELRDVLEEPRKAVSTAAAEFLNALDREFLNVEYAKISPSDWWSLSTKALDSAYALHAVAAPALGGVLEARAQALGRQLVVTIALLLLAGAVVTGLAVFIIRDLNRPLQEAVLAADRLAMGDLSVHLSANGRGDEVGALARAFEHMVQSLRRVAEAADRISRGDLAVTLEPQSEQDLLGQALSRMVRGLQEELRTLQEEIRALGETNRNVSSALVRLMNEAQRATQAVREATRTVEEVKQVSEAASRRAAEVAAAGEQAVAISEIGEKAVQDAIKGIENVREQMKLIVKKIAQLGEQTRAIAQITATVNDIADQSDLLSVNAGIEAVRAGVHGKGFAVVAQEVKNLSDRSKRATAQIATILADIQKAAQDVILASEQATKAAETGIQQTLDSGETIRTLAQSLAEATASVANLTQTTQRQLVDMEQVVDAMKQIDEASRANLQSVEQIEHSIQSLAEVSSSLQQLVKRYRLSA